jgi:hypothetical protein
MPSAGFKSAIASLSRSQPYISRTKIMSASKTTNTTTTSPTFTPYLCSIYKMRKTSTPELRDVLGRGGGKRKIYCQGTVSRRSGLVALRTVKLGLTKVGNQANH